MDDSRRKKAVIVVIVFAVIAVALVGNLLLLSGFFGPKPDGTVGPLDTVEGPVSLGSVEVREYKGAKLGSMEDFRENSIKGPQYIDRDAYRLKITGLVDEPQSLTYGQVLEENQLYRKVVTLNCVEGWSVKVLWDGVLVRDVIEKAGVQEEAKVLIFKAADGYTTSLPIEFFYERDVLMAHGMNNVTLDPERGFPFQLVAEMKWGYKWIKWITEIELSSDVNYKGYWEERGYSNSGDLDDGPMD